MLPRCNDELEAYLTSSEITHAPVIFADAMVDLSGVPHQEFALPFRYSSNQRHLCFKFTEISRENADKFFLFLKSIDPNTTRKDRPHNNPIASKFKVSNTPAVRHALMMKFKNDFLKMDADKVIKLPPRPAGQPKPDFSHLNKLMTPLQRHKQFQESMELFLNRQLISTTHTDIFENVLLNKIAKAKTTPSSTHYRLYFENDNLIHFTFRGITDEDADQLVAYLRNVCNDRFASRNNLIPVSGLFDLDPWVSAHDEKCLVASVEVLHKLVFPRFMQEVTAMRMRQDEEYKSYLTQSRADKKIKNYKLQLSLYDTLEILEKAIPAKEYKIEFAPVFQALKTCLRGFDADKTRDAHKKFMDLLVAHPDLHNLTATTFNVGFNAQYPVKSERTQLYYVSHSNLRKSRTHGLRDISHRLGLFGNELILSTSPVTPEQVQGATKRP